MRQKNILIAALIFLVFSMPLVSAGVGDLVVGLGQNFVISSVPVIGQAYSAVQLAQQVITVGTAFATGGVAGVAAIGGQVALSTLTSVAGTKGLSVIVGQQAASTILEIKGYGEVLTKDSKLENIKINGTTGIVSSGSIKIKQKDGTEKTVTLQNLKFSFDEKRGISTYTFDEKGALQVGSLKYENIKKGGTIKTDKDGNVIEADFTSSALSTYAFENSEPLTVAGNTRITYKDGVINVYGDSFKYGGDQIQNFEKDGVSIKVSKNMKVKCGTRDCGIRDLTTFSGKNFVVKGIKVYGDNGGIGSLSFEKVTFATGYTEGLKTAGSEYGQLNYFTYTPTKKPLTIERMVKSSDTTIEIPEGLKISGSEVIIGDTDYSNEGIKNQIYFAGGLINYVGTKGSSFSIEIQEGNKFGIPANGKVKFTTREDAISFVEISKSDSGIGVLFSSSSGTLIDDGEGKITLKEGLLYAQAARACKIYSVIQERMYCQENYGTTTPLSLQVTNDIELTEQECQKLGIGNIQTPHGCKLKVSGFNNYFLHVSEIDSIGLKKCAVPGAVAGAAVGGILGKAIGLTGFAESEVVCKDSCSGNVLMSPEKSIQEAEKQAKKDQMGLAAQKYAEAADLYYNQAKNEQDPQKISELTAKAREANGKASKAYIEKSDKLIQNMIKNSARGEGINADLQQLESLLNQAAAQAYSSNDKLQLISVATFSLNTEEDFKKSGINIGQTIDTAIDKINNYYIPELKMKEEAPVTTTLSEQQQKEARINAITNPKMVIASVELRGRSESAVKETALRNIDPDATTNKAISDNFDKFTPKQQEALKNVINGNPVPEYYIQWLKTGKAKEFLNSVGFKVK